MTFPFVFRIDGWKCALDSVGVGLAGAAHSAGTGDSGAGWAGPTGAATGNGSGEGRENLG